MHPILQKVQQLGFKVFTDGDYDLNIIGVRKANGTPNAFDDTLYCIYKVNGVWQVKQWKITTDPGLYWLNNPMNRMGTAAVVADRQYRSLWQIGLHKGSYKALVQANDVSVHRDTNKDSKVDYDPGNIQTGHFGINCHRATENKGGSIRVDKWSAGCQVFADPDDFAEFLSICDKQVSQRGWTKFTYTLLNE
jgi:hypothetical protein